MGPAIFIKPYNDDTDEIKLAYNLLDVIDLNVISPIRLALNDISENVDHELTDAVATINSALRVWKCVDKEIRGIGINDLTS